MTVLGPLARGLALLGGVVLLAVALLATGSIACRWLLGKPLLGDVELAQIGCAIAIAMFLPYCQLHRGHIIVDFFTAGVTARTRNLLDAAGALLLAAVFCVLAWRAGVAVTEMKANGETSMLLGFPTWLTYSMLVPGLALSGLVAIAQATQLLRGRP